MGSQGLKSAPAVTERLKRRWGLGRSGAADAVAGCHVDRFDRAAGAGILHDDDLEAWQLASAGLALPLVGDVGHLLQCLDRGYPRHVVLGIVGDGIEAVQVAGLERIAKHVALGPVERQHVRLVEREAERARGEACSLCLVVALPAPPNPRAAPAATMVS